MSTNIRKIALYCPVCGNDQFSCIDEELEDVCGTPDDTRFQCADCKSIFTKAELIEENQDLINENIEEVKETLIKDFEKKLRKIFR